MAQHKSDRTWVSVELSREVADALRARARASERSIAGQLRLLIRDYLSTTGEGAGQGASADEPVGVDDRASAAA
jgi:hypothetical protein